MNLVEMSFWAQQKPFSIYYHCMGLNIWQYDPSMSMFIHERPIHPTSTSHFALIFLQGAYLGTFPKLYLNLVFSKICKINDRKNHTVHCFQTLSQ